MSIDTDATRLLAHLKQWRSDTDRTIPVLEQARDYIVELVDTLCAIEMEAGIAERDPALSDEQRERMRRIRLHASAARPD